MRAKIVNFQGLSSHADRDHLLNWIDQFTPRQAHPGVCGPRRPGGGSPPSPPT